MHFREMHFGEDIRGKHRELATKVKKAGTSTEKASMRAKKVGSNLTKSSAETKEEKFK